MTINQILKFLKIEPTYNGHEIRLDRNIVESTSTPIAMMEAVVIDDMWIRDEENQHLYEDDVEEISRIIRNIKEVFEEYGIPYYGTGYVKGSTIGPWYTVAMVRPYFAKPEANAQMLDNKILQERIRHRRYRRRIC